MIRMCVQTDVHYTYTTYTTTCIFPWLTKQKLTFDFPWDKMTKQLQYIKTAYLNGFSVLCSDFVSPGVAKFVIHPQSLWFVFLHQQQNICSSYICCCAKGSVSAWLCAYVLGCQYACMYADLCGWDSVCLFCHNHVTLQPCDPDIVEQRVKENRREVEQSWCFCAMACWSLFIRHDSQLKIHCNRLNPSMH